MEEQKKRKKPAIEAITGILPHRYPMLLIDAVPEYEAGVYAVAEKSFSYNEAFFAGHYPGRPIVPGTILLEGLSQTASFAVLSGEGCGGVDLLFTGVSRLRFYKAVLPGDRVIFRAEVIKGRHGFWDVRGEGRVEGRMCISAEMTFADGNGKLMGGCV